MGLHQVLFTIVFVLPSLSLAHSQPLGHTHSHVEQQQIGNGLPQVDEAGQRMGSSPVYIYNNNRDEVSSGGVQSQPTTFVQAAPLSKSRAEQMRSARKDMEIKTEEKIVEKLEESRIVDEQKRAERLFGNRINSVHTNDNSEWQQAQPVQAAPAPVAPAPAPVVAAPVMVEEVSQPAITNTVVINSSKGSEVVEQEDGSLSVSQANTLSAGASSSDSLFEGAKTYISPAVGMVDHAEASNVEGQGAIGGALGIIYDSGLALEGSFIYSNHAGAYDYFVNGNINDIRRNNVDIDQYSVGALAKYYIGKNRLQPFVGGVLSYTRREYSSQSSVFSSNSSNAFDAGLTAGVDVAVNSQFTVGLDYRYMQNISNEYDTQITSNGVPTPQVTTNGLFLQQADTSGGGFQNLEEMSYHVWMLTGKLMF